MVTLRTRKLQTTSCKGHSRLIIIILVVVVVVLIN